MKTCSIRKWLYYLVTPVAVLKIADRKIWQLSIVWRMLIFYLEPFSANTACLSPPSPLPTGGSSPSLHINNGREKPKALGDRWGKDYCQRRAAILNSDYTDNAIMRGKGNLERKRFWGEMTTVSPDKYCWFPRPPYISEMLRNWVSVLQFFALLTLSLDGQIHSKLPPEC